MKITSPPLPGQSRSPITVAARFKARAASDGNDRTRQFVISTDTRDRHGTVITLDGWSLDTYNEVGVVNYNHRWAYTSDPDDVLGSGRAFIEDGTLVGEVCFEEAENNPKAEKVLRKVDNEILKSASVTFMPEDGHWGRRSDNEDPNTFYITHKELIEWSIVPVASNPEAKKRATEALEAFTRSFTKEGEATNKEAIETRSGSIDNAAARLAFLKLKQI